MIPPVNNKRGEVTLKGGDNADPKEMVNDSEKTDKYIKTLTI